MKSNINPITKWVMIASFFVTLISIGVCGIALVIFENHSLFKFAFFVGFIASLSFWGSVAMFVIAKLKEK